MFFYIYWEEKEYLYVEYIFIYSYDIYSTYKGIQ